MASGSDWGYARPALNEVLSAWLETHPSPALVGAIHEALMDLIRDPLGWASEDPSSPGVFHRTVSSADGLRVGILYVIADPTSREVALADIRTEAREG